ncbi:MULTISPECIES: flavodoxin family protein [unclassified Clostridioides]|uniref:flavodoxin family protein n=1 Tax=unclassified Clostridioides TaxID=2635829 RepID=UPI001D12EFEA|nr:flavodoxin family protein [Clostridioides sp. ES-S-0049-03]MCC0675997.1 flavodoxin family protein [Clostridioides sp. ES-W-0018-02]MCC0710924.1 flavodoxin family protein [Clostridioides sp. ES-W-0017-02]
MNKKVLIISTSFRKDGNSEMLADMFLKGAKESGNIVEKICLYDKTIHFCKGCLACQNTKTGHCIMQDDADMIVQKMMTADVIVFSTPIYFYEMSGQMKTLLDRSNPLFPLEYSFRDIYLLTTAADKEEHAMDGAVKGLQGWIDCFENATLKDVLRGTGADEYGSISALPNLLSKAYQMGKVV